jgi:uncharacterized phiE125 gp8 family phage protein
MIHSIRATRTEPSEEPVSIPELRDAARITAKTHDAQLGAFLIAARKVIEESYLWRALITQTCVDRFDSFADEMELRWSPVQSLTSVAYLDTDEDSQTLAATYYELGQNNGLGIVRLKYDQSWPTVLSHPDSVTVTSVCGYGDDAEDVPQPIRQAIILHALWQHTQREGMEYPGAAISSLLGPYISHRCI